MQTTLPKHTIVLLGIGHTNAHVLRMWRMKPIENAQLVCVSNMPVVTYSGMLPGVLANQYPVERMEIDLVRLCASAGARLIVGEVVGLDLESRSLQFENRPELPFDVLSIGVGSVPNRTEVEAAEGSLLAIKPMQTFLERLHQRLQTVVERVQGRSPRIGIVGAGAGGSEITLCLPARLKQWFSGTEFEITLFNSQRSVVSGALPRTAQLVEREMQDRGIQMVLGHRVMQVTDHEIKLDNGANVDVDLTIWATGAAPPPVLSKLGLQMDDRGFLLTKADLQVVEGHPIFVVGDSGTIADSPTSKAGVYAVRQGPFLWQNIQRTLENLPLRKYIPQKDFLTLLNLGNGQAIAQYKGRTFKGAWCWKLKDFIDGRFMDKYQDYEPMQMEASSNDKHSQMRCMGCGGKVGGSVLSRVLSKLDVRQNEHVVVGLDQPDDAAVVQIPSGRPVTVTADFFAAPLDDPFIVGRIAALNSASDVFAIGAKPVAALALATIPVGSPRRQEQVLYETLAGSMHEFRKMDTALVGGHTIEGPTLTVGFTVLADQGDERPRTKGRLRVEDHLILTKPLGSGILLAGHMQAKCRAVWMDDLLKAMLLSNQLAAEITSRFDIPGLTDITGFGLAGHLHEMLKASGLGAQLKLDQIPLLRGAAELIKDGIESTLAPANRDTEAVVHVSECDRHRPEYAAIFDPQTCGGLLLGVAPQHVDSVMRELHAQSDVPAQDIGEVVPYTGDTRISIV